VKGEGREGEKREFEGDAIKRTPFLFQLSTVRTVRRRLLQTRLKKKEKEEKWREKKGETLAMTLAVGWLLGQNSAWQVAIQARMACTSSAVRTKDAATKSMSLLTPYLRV